MTQVQTQEATLAPHAVDTAAEPIYGLMAEFEDVNSVVAAARAVRDAGYRFFDVHSPFPIHGIDEALDVRPTILPWLVLVGGLTGMAAGLVLTIWTMSVNYPYLISGKPFNSLPAWIPVVFECTILLAAFASVGGMLLLNKLPMLYHPLLKMPSFQRATSDRFFVVVQARDSRFDLQRTADLLRQQGASEVEVVEA